MKVCRRCNASKPEVAFSKHSYTKDGLRSWCRECESIRCKELRWWASPKGKKASEHGRTLSGYKWCLLQSNARRRGLSVGLTRKWHEALLTDATCFYCFGPLPKSGTGLDRVDSSLGYELWNVVPCCTTCNRIKSNEFSLPAMLRLGQTIHSLKMDQGTRMTVSESGR